MDDFLPGTHLCRVYDDGDRQIGYAYHGDGGERSAIDEAHGAGIRAVVYDGWHYVRIGNRWWRSWRHIDAQKWQERRNGR